MTNAPMEKPRFWDGVFGSFAEAGGENNVFEGDVWLRKINARAQEALASSRSQCAIPPVAETRDYALPYVAAMALRREFWISTRHGGELFFADRDAADRSVA